MRGFPQMYHEVYEMSASVSLYPPVASLLLLSLFLSKANPTVLCFSPLPSKQKSCSCYCPLSGFINFSFILAYSDKICKRAVISLIFSKQTHISHSISLSRYCLLFLILIMTKLPEKVVILAASTFSSLIFF